MLLILIIIMEVTYMTVKYSTESDVVTVGYLFRSCYLNHGHFLNIFIYNLFLILQKMSVIFLIASYLLYVAFV